MRIRKFILFVEWTLLIVIGGSALLLMLPYSDMYHFNRDIKEAKRQGIYYEGSSKKQTYYGRRIRVDGVVYDKNQLIVYMTGAGMGPSNKLPNRVQVRSETGQLLDSSSGGSSTNVLRSRGYFEFRDVPIGLEQITIFNESYGQSFSFLIPLEGGDNKDE
ncbi:MAG: hypothetical protein ACE3L7_26190 [Candidatus Pristimantibacillus sp.]